MSTACVSFAPNQMPRLLYATKKVGQEHKITRSLHKHNTCTELLYIYQGLGTYIVDGYHYDIHPGDFLLYNMGTLHEITSVNSREIADYCFGIADLQLVGLPLGHMCTPDMGFVRPAQSHPELVTLTHMLYDTMESDLPYRQDLSRSLLQSLLLLALNLPPDDRAFQQDEELVLATRIRHYIDTHFTEPLSLQTISDALHVSPYHASHIFKNVNGISPIHYMIRCRIGEAQNLLIASNFTASQIAALVGYSSVHHFNSIFSKIVGLPPIRYRKQYLESMQGTRTQ